MVDYAALIAQAAEEGPDYNEAVTTGGGDREPPAAGLTRLRFISYIEIGDHMDGKKGEEKRKPMAKLQFELSGPKHQPKKLDDGRVIPHVITLTLPVSRNEKSNYYKLFKRMNWGGKHKIMAQMLGEDFLGTVVHKESGEGTNKRTYANLRDEGGYTIRSPFVEDPETGESKRVAADPQITATKCFLWDYASKEMWDALFIDGKYDDKKDEAGNVIKEGISKNYWQNTIRSALNFNESPIFNLLSGGDALNLPDSVAPERSEEAKQASEAAKVKTPANDTDPLAAVG
jgi:hypothetical protein